MLDADVDAVDGVDGHAVDLELLEGLDEVRGALPEILRLELRVGGRLVEYLDLGKNVVAALLDNLAGAGLLDLIGLHNKHLARIGAERLRRLAPGFGFVLFFRDRLRLLGLLFLSRGVRGNADVIRLDEVGAGCFVLFRAFVRNINWDEHGLARGLGGFLRLGDRNRGADDFHLFAAKFSGGRLAAALLFSDGERGGLTFGIPGA